MICRQIRPRKLQVAQGWQDDEDDNDDDHVDDNQDNNFSEVIATQPRER